MGLQRKEKEGLVADLQEKFKSAKVAILTDFTGLNVDQMTELRRQLRQAGTEYKVVKNTLLRRASENTDLALLADYFDGPNGIALSSEDLVASAKVMTEFREDNPALLIKVGVVEGHVLEPEQIKTLAFLPSREILLGKLLALMQAGPGRLVQVLNSPLQRLMLLLGSVKRAKESSEQ